MAPVMPPKTPWNGDSSLNDEACCQSTCPVSTGTSAERKARPADEQRDRRAALGDQQRRDQEQALVAPPHPQGGGPQPADGPGMAELLRRGRRAHRRPPTGSATSGETPSGPSFQSRSASRYSP